MKGSRGRWLIFLALLLAAGATFAHRTGVESAIDVSSFATDSPSRIPMVAVRARQHVAGAPVAFLVHGYQCNKSMMLQLAKHLALNGIDAYAIDLPGHGASGEPHSDQRAAPVAAEALEYLERRLGLPPEQVVLVGHSYGASVLGRIAPARPGHPATVFLGPGNAPGLTPETPRDLLVVTAGQDYDFVIANARAIMAEASGAGRPAPGLAAGSFERGDARRWSEVAGVGHVGLVLDPRVFHEVLDWIGRATGYRPPAERAPATAASLALALLLPATLLAAALLSVRRGGEGAPPQARPRGGQWIPWLTLALGWLVGLMVPRYVVPLGFLRLQEGEVLASIMLVAGLLGAALDVAVYRGAHLPPLREALRGAPAALVAVAALYACAALLIERDFYHVTLSGPRAAIAAALAATLFPLFALVEGLAPKRGLQRAVATVLVYAVAASTLSLVGLRLERFGPALLALGLAGGGIGWAVGRVARAPGAAPVFTALLSGWIVAVGFLRY